MCEDFCAGRVQVYVVTATSAMMQPLPKPAEGVAHGGWVAYLLGADNPISPLLSRLRGAQQPVVRPRHACVAPCSHLLARFLTDPSRSFVRPSSWPTFYRACGCGHGGTRNNSTSRRVQTWSVSPAAMAGVHGRHRLA